MFRGNPVGHYEGSYRNPGNNFAQESITDIPSQIVWDNPTGILQDIFTRDGS